MAEKPVKLSSNPVKPPPFPHRPKAENPAISTGLTKSHESFPLNKTPRKVRNAIAWSVISLAVGLVFSFEGGFSSFQAVMQSMREADPQTVAIVIPSTAFLVCLFTVFGQILGDTMTDIVFSREEKGLGESGTNAETGSVWNRNLLSWLVGWAVNIQERFVSASRLEGLLENELVQKCFPIFTRIIAVIGGASGAVYLAAFLRLLGGTDNLPLLFPLEIGAFSLFLLVIAFTSASPIILLPAFGVELVIRGFGLFDEGGAPGLALLELLFGAFFLLIFLRAMKNSISQKK
ncbi:MAG: hypothetical protein WA705_08380 [Candidatus Ozemobacteraceae bacterium]